MPLLYVISETLLNVMQSSSNHTYVCMLVTDKRIFNYSYVCSMSIYLGTYMYMVYIPYTQYTENKKSNRVAVYTEIPIKKMVTLGL